MVAVFMNSSFLFFFVQRLFLWKVPQANNNIFVYKQVDTAMKINLKDGPILITPGRKIGKLYIHTL